MSERGLRADLTSVVCLRGNPGPPPAMSVVLHVYGNNLKDTFISRYIQNLLENEIV